MWYKIPTGVDQIYKGWKISISTTSTFSKKLSVTISPGIEFNMKAFEHLPIMERFTMMSEFDSKLRSKSHSFMVSDRFLGIFEFTTPWDKAMNEAHEYIEGLGPFDIEAFIKRL